MPAEPVPLPSPLFRALRLPSATASDNDSLSDATSESTISSDEPDEPLPLRSSGSRPRIVLAPPILRARCSAKLSTAIIACRRALDGERWPDVLPALLSVDALLRGQAITVLGLVVAILGRLHDNLTHALERSELADKSGRRRLTADGAKAVVQLRSRWTRIRDGDPWRQVVGIVRAAEAPPWAADPLPPGTAAILVGLEASMLLPSPGRLSMARAYGRDVPPVLEHVDAAVRWYQGFELDTSSEVEARTRAALDRIVTLDLSHNALTSVPTSVFRHLRGIATLDLSRNAFAALPFAIGRLPHLQRLVSDGNPLCRPNAAALLRQARTAPRARGGVPSLVTISLGLAKARRVDPDILPPHLADALRDGYLCAAQSCRSAFVAAGDPRWLAAPLYIERLVLDQRLTFGGSRLCSDCMIRLR